MSIQQVHETIETATKAAIELSKELGYAAIILSKGQYYVETGLPMIRTWETLIAEYENGKKME